MPERNASRVRSVASIAGLVERARSVAFSETPIPERRIVQNSRPVAVGGSRDTKPAREVMGLNAREGEHHRIERDLTDPPSHGMRDSARCTGRAVDGDFRADDQRTGAGRVRRAGGAGEYPVDGA